VPDPLGKLTNARVLFQRCCRELLPRMALDSRLHPAQLGDALLQSRDAAFHMLPRLFP
jgi:hypothetical protein